MANLALTLALSGAAEKALPLQREVVALRRETLGADHPDTRDSVEALAELLRQVGKGTEADALTATLRDAESPPPSR